ncbi:conserved hypothetical protein [Maribacter litoralis]|uniref:DUF4174 domain-containing protein n=2 Tax=Maribacter litoralis TaxID=2059726 RepID=A0A653N2K7_9FLAO|nr:conserved hypothetical protein [Maribacter litoralis]
MFTFIPMNTLKIVSILIMMFSSITKAQDITDFKWNNRLIILYENNNNVAEVKSAIEIIAKNSVGLVERDVRVFVLKNNVFYSSNGQALEITNSKTLPKAYQGYILVGKDGGIKSKKPYPFNLNKIFDLIDSMPMRKSEMRSNR